MIGRASISILNLSLAVTIENAPGIDCGLFGGYSETDPRNIMFCTPRNFSPPWAMKAAFASSIGVLSGVITTAGAVEEPLSAVGALFAGGCSCARTLAPKQITIARDKTTRFISSLSIRSSIAPVHRCDDYQRRRCRHHQRDRTLLPHSATHQNWERQDYQPASQDSRDSGRSAH